MNLIDDGEEELPTPPPTTTTTTTTSATTNSTMETDTGNDDDEDGESDHDSMTAKTKTKIAKTQKTTTSSPMNSTAAPTEESQLEKKFESFVEVPNPQANLSINASLNANGSRTHVGIEAKLTSARRPTNGTVLLKTGNMTDFEKDETNDEEHKEVVDQILELAEDNNDFVSVCYALCLPVDWFIRRLVELSVCLWDSVSV